jgi:hypothetical protein
VRRQGDPRYLHLKLVLFAVASALFLGALVTGWEELALVALGVLALALALRFLPRAGSEQGGGRPGESGDDAG